jgi:hypothetical protein
VFLGTWEGGTPRDSMSGGELLGVLTWTADYMEQHPNARTAVRQPPTGEKIEMPAEGDTVEPTSPDVTSSGEETSTEAEDDAEDSGYLWATPENDK